MKTIDILNGLTHGRGTVVQRDIRYGNHRRHKLDIYAPRKLLSPAPMILFFYGGRWRRGERWDYRFLGRALARQGYVAALADYRLHPEVAYPDFLHDGAAALGYLHKHAPIIQGDPNRLFVMGHSAGAYMAAMLALKEDHGVHDKIRGVIGISGPYDFSPQDETIADVFAPEPDRQKNQPIFHTSGAKPPFLLIHGISDTTVGARNSKALAEALQQNGNRAETRYYRNFTHKSILLPLVPPFRFLAPLQDEIDQFVTSL